jgi:hypothetical protein
MRSKFSLFVFCFFFCLFSIYDVDAQVTVSASAGVLSGTYSNLSAAFSAVNSGTHQGVINITITGNTTEPALVTPLLNSALPSNYLSILIKPSGGNWTISSSASPTSQRGIIELSGADNVTIDGDDQATPGIRNLTIQSSVTTNTGVACVRISSNSTTGSDGASNNIIKNCIIIGPRNSATSTITSYGINMSNYSTTSMTTGAYSNANITIQNNEIRRCYTGIFAKGASNLYPNTGLKILNNIIGSSVLSDNIGLRGVLVDYTSTFPGIASALIEGNDIRAGDVSANGPGHAANVTGIEIGTVNSGIQVIGNNIHDILQPYSLSPFGAYGINITGAASCDNFLIANNFINNVVATKGNTNVTLPTAFGIRIIAGATFMKISHNTIVLNAAQVGSILNYSNYGVATTVTTPSISEFKNNIIINNNQGTGTYCFHLLSNGSLLPGASDNNNFYSNNGNVGYFNSSNQTSLLAWKTSTAQDANSISTPVTFVGANDLHIDVSAQSSVLIDGAGASGTGVLNDFDLQPRSSTPDLGADEFTLPNCTGTPSFFNTAITPTAVCSGGSVNLSAATAVPASGYTFQWKSSNSPTGPFSNISNATTSAYTTSVSSTTYFQLVATCSFSGLSGNSSILTASVNPNPTVVLTPSNNGIFCGSAGQTITASGANTFAWSPGSSLNTTSGNSVVSTTSTTVTYSVLATNTTTGCSSDQTITVGPPTINVTSSTNNFCGSGSTFTMTASSIDPSMSYSWTKLTSSATLNSSSGTNVGASVTETSEFQITGIGSGTYAGCTSLQNISIGVYPLPNASVTSTPSSICPGGSSIINSGLSSTNFSSSCLVPNATNPPANSVYLVNNGTAVVNLTSGNLDDGGWGNVPLGFNFDFFGSVYNNINIGTNGVVQFGSYNAAALNDYTIGALPNTIDPLGAIFIAANDLDASVSGNPATYVRYWTEGFAPNRKFIIEYNLFQWNSVSNRVNTRATLYETIGQIDIVVNEATSTNAKSIGINSPSGLIGETASNCSVTPVIPNYWTAQTSTIPAGSPSAWRFSPPSNFNMVWTGTSTLGTTTIANGINIFSQPVSPAINTTYNISYTNQITGCSNTIGSAQTQITVLSNIPPSGLITVASNTLVCASTAFQLGTSYSGSVAGLNFQWQVSIDGGNTWSNVFGLNTPTVSVSQISDLTYRCEVSSCGGASSFSTPVTVLVQTPPSVTVSSSTNIYCGSINNPVVLNVTGSGVNYNWTPSQGLSDTTGVSVLATPAVSTIYTVTATDTLGCTNSMSINIESQPPVVFNELTASPAAICTGSGTLLTANAINGTAPTGYCKPEYSAGTGSGDYISLVQLENINNQTGGASAPYYTIFPANGPTTTTLTAGSTYTLTLQAGTYSANDLAAFIDYNQNVILDDLNEKLGETNDLGPLPAQTTIVFTVPSNAKNGLTVLRIREMDAVGVNYIDPCSNLSTFGEVEDYIITIVGGINPVFNYSWSPSNLVTNPNSASTSVSSLTTSQNFIVSATSLAGCQVTDTINISVLSAPSAPVIGDTVVCSGSNLTMSANGSGIILWYDAPSNGNLLGSGSIFNTPVLFSNSSYWVKDSLPGGCVSNSEQVLVNVNPSPVVYLGQDTSQCGGNIILDALNTGATYTWSNQQNSQAITINNSGQYSVLVENSFGCKGADTVNVILNYLPDVNIGVDSIYCANDLVLNALNPGNHYQWSTGDTTQYIDISGSGIYFVTVLTDEGCVGSDTINITLIPTPVVNLGQDTLICNGNLILDAQNTGATYLWSDGSTFPILFVNTTGTYWVDVTNSQNCTTRDSITVTVDPCLLQFNSDISEFSVYPNPTNGDFFIESNITKEDITMELLDVQGKLILKKVIKPIERERIQVDYFDSGIYTLKLFGSDKLSTFRIALSK